MNDQHLDSNPRIAFFSTILGRIIAALGIVALALGIVAEGFSLYNNSLASG